MKIFKLQIADEALQEIQDAIDWYEEQQLGVGRRFHK